MKQVEPQNPFRRAKIAGVILLALAGIWYAQYTPPPTAEQIKNAQVLMESMKAMSAAPGGAVTTQPVTQTPVPVATPAAPVQLPPQETVQTEVITPPEPLQVQEIPEVALIPESPNVNPAPEAVATLQPSVVEGPEWFLYLLVQNKVLRLKVVAPADAAEVEMLREKLKGAMIGQNCTPNSNCGTIIEDHDAFLDNQEAANARASKPTYLGGQLICSTPVKADCFKAGSQLSLVREPQSGAAVLASDLEIFSIVPNQARRQIAMAESRKVKRAYLTFRGQP